MKEVRARFGTALRVWRTERDFSQEELAEKSGLSYKFIGEIERGKGNPSLETLASLADALKIGLADLFAPFQREGVAVPVSEDYRLTKHQYQALREVVASIPRSDLPSGSAYRVKRRKR